MVVVLVAPADLLLEVRLGARTLDLIEQVLDGVVEWT